MRKRVAVPVVAIAILALAVSVSACGGSSSKTESTSYRSTDHPIETIVGSNANLEAGWWHFKASDPPQSEIRGYSRQGKAPTPNELRFAVHATSMNIELDTEVKVLQAEAIYESGHPSSHFLRVVRNWNGKSDIPLTLTVTGDSGKQRELRLIEVYVIARDQHLLEGKAHTKEITDKA